MESTNYASEMLCKLSKLRRNRTLCDTVIATSDGELWAHSVVLAAASELMCKNFLSSSDASRSHYKVNLPKCELLSVEIVIRYLYTGCIVLPISYQGSKLFNEILAVSATLGMDIAKMNQVTVSFVQNSKDLKQLSLCDPLGISAGNDINHDSNQCSSVEDCVTSETSTTAADPHKSETLSPIQQNSNDIDPIIGQVKVESSSIVLSEIEDESIDMETSREQQPYQKMVNSKIISRSRRSKTTKSNNANNNGMKTAKNEDVSLDMESPVEQQSSQTMTETRSVRYSRRSMSTKNKKAESDSTEACSSYSCVECNETFTSNRRLLRHSAVVHNIDIKRRFTCEYCGKKLQRLRDLQTHTVQHTGIKPFLCDTCGKRYTEKSTLDLHVCRYHVNEEQMFKCRYCQESFFSQRRKTEHEAIHSGESLYTCETCGKSFKSMPNLKKHVKLHTGIKPYVCPVCEGRFTQKTTLTNHIAALHGDEKVSLVCPICGKSIAGRNQSNLKAHINTHSIVPKSHICTICMKSFKWTDHLVRHMKRHGEKPHSCNECNRTYLTASLLRSHARSHVKRPCEVCKKLFSGIVSLKNHQKIVHGMDKSNVCCTCGERFSDEKLLLEHRYTHRFRP